jgi:hypothetical protein
VQLNGGNLQFLQQARTGLKRQKADHAPIVGVVQAGEQSGIQKLRQDTRDGGGGHPDPIRDMPDGSPRLLRGTGEHAERKRRYRAFAHGCDEQSGNAAGRRGRLRRTEVRHDFPQARSDGVKTVRSASSRIRETFITADPPQYRRCIDLYPYQTK